MYYLWVDIVFSIIFIVLIIMNLLQLARSCLKWKRIAKKRNEVSRRSRASLNIMDEKESVSRARDGGHSILVVINLMLTLGLLCKKV